MPKTKEQLHAEMVRARRAYDRVEAAERYAKNKPLVGQCFKVRNCYSSPQKPSDYWWLYVKLLRIDGYHFQAFSFQTDKHGRIEIRTSDYHAGTDGCISISAAEFNRAWSATKKRIAGMKP